MRIDKYLWCIRVFKTRSIATTACKKGQIKIDSKSVKPSRDIFGGELMVIRKNQINYQIKALDLPESRVGAKLLDQFRKDVTPKEAFAKKDRRDIDNYQEEGEEDSTEDL
jgi:ribosome-associated heat shock protein Hsp15